MKINVRRQIEIVTNIAIILVSISIGYFIVTEKILNRSSTKNEQNPASIKNTLVKGQKIPLSSIDWEKNRKTLLLVLSSECKFCNESADFYKKLVTENTKFEKIKIVAGFPQNIEIGKEYLKNHSIELTDVLHILPSDIGARGTPTIILVNNNGTVEDFWIGKLPTEKEAEILRLFVSIS